MKCKKIMTSLLAASMTATLIPDHQEILTAVPLMGAP